MSETFDIKLALKPVSELRVYQNDIKMHRELRFKAKKGKGTGNRKAITHLSNKALMALAFIASNTTVDFKIMVTLTYPGEMPTCGREVKRHLNVFMTALRRKRENLDYLWWMEFQDRGAVHFHILLTTPYLCMKWVANRWYEIVNSKERNHLNAGTEVKRLKSAKKARHYVVSYMHKAKQKIAPIWFEHMGRWYGTSRRVIPKMVRTIQVLGYEDAKHYLQKWNYKYIINHDSMVVVLFNATEFLI